jgi:hypothetical protein
MLHGAHNLAVSKPTFKPRVTLVLVLALAIFFVLALIVAAPAVFEPLPADAPPDALAGHVKARLAGKTGWLFALSVLLAGLTQFRRGR